VAIYRLGDDTPRVAAGAWVADSATVVGNVEIGAGATIWFGAVVRADNDLISIGDGSSVQDGAVLHTDPGYRLVVGANVTIGHQVMLHGCRIGDGSLVGIQTIVLNGAAIGRNCLVGAGSLITEGKQFPDGVLILGRPAKVVRELRADELESLVSAARVYVEKAARYSRTLVKVAP
jgi:carbonic anhydrase/acetyltransferase-like protein (isoleucine patch superfamily)